MTIISILPKGEGFNSTQFGAIALCVRDFTLHSRWRKEIIVISGTGSHGYPGIAFAPAPRPRWWQGRTGAYTAHCAQVITQHQAVLAEIHNRPSMLLMLAGKAVCALALHLHNDPQEMAGAKAAAEREALLTRADGVYCVSDYIRARLLEGVSPALHAKAHTVPNGIALPARLPEKEKLVVFAGRMTEGKGALLLAEALAQALPQMQGWRAVIVGSGRHSACETLTPYEQRVAQALEPVKAQARMAGFLGHEETMALFGQAAIAVIPSLWQEPFGRTAIEAMALGCAIIHTGRGALGEVVGNAGLALAQADAATLAQALTLLANDDAQRARLQAGARARAAEFSIESCAAMLDSARDRILAKRADHAA